MQQGVFNNEHLDATIEALSSKLTGLLGVEVGDIGQIEIRTSLQFSEYGVDNNLFIFFYNFNSSFPI